MGDDGLVVVRSAASGRPLWERHLGRGPFHDMRVQAFPTGERILAYGRGTGVLQLDAASGELVRFFPLSTRVYLTVYFCVISPTGSQVARLRFRSISRDRLLLA